ncbi:MAG: diguanylate cyclase [Gammaproteobacteria bacterium]|nr:diguanylate cyclase [Gammaproteobacteria bacterium]
MRALITENNPVYRNMLEHTLAEQGFDTDTVDSIEIARSYVDSEIYDIIYVNQELKDGRGEQFVAYCNDHDRHKDTPILFLTENSELTAEKLPVKVGGLIHEINEHQIVHFIDLHLDPVFFEGRILFIEDDEVVVSEILAQLKETGYRVTHFRTAEEASAEFDAVTVYGSHAEAYDLVITRLKLKGKMSGDELVSFIRSYEDGRGFIPIIVITDIDSDERRIALYQSGVNDFLQKPILHEELLVRIRNLITNKRLLDKVHDIRRELFSLATTDKLTGCHNRHSLMDFSEKFISQARRHHYPISMLVIDLDYFKMVNDNHGHATGDMVLELTGELLNSSFRDGDLVSRYGGEEFVVLMPHCDGKHARMKAEKLRIAIEELKPVGHEITTSIGVTSIEVGCEKDFEAMFRAGDEGVYSAKDNGRNQVVFVSLD